MKYTCRRQHEQRKYVVAARGYLTQTLELGHTISSTRHNLHVTAEASATTLRILCCALLRALREDEASIRHSEEDEGDSECGRFGGDERDTKWTAECGRRGNCATWCLKGPRRIVAGIEVTTHGSVPNHRVRRRDTLRLLLLRLPPFLFRRPDASYLLEYPWYAIYNPCVKRIHPRYSL